MGVPIVVVGKKYICPMSDGTKPHVGGKVTEGIGGVSIDGMPIAVVGSKCECTGSSKANSITVGSPGVFVDGEPVAIVGSMTEHGGVIIEGVSGVTISGGFPLQEGNKEKPEPRIFNLQWRKENSVVRYGKSESKVTITGETVGYDEGETVKLDIYDESGESVDIVEGIVRNGRFEIEWDIEKEGE